MEAHYGRNSSKNKDSYGNMDEIGDVLFPVSGVSIFYFFFIYIYIEKEKNQTPALIYPYFHTP